jgi:hypothetical protein
VSDAELQELRRRWLADRDTASELALLLALRRQGAINDVLIELAQLCASEAAEQARGEGAWTLDKWPLRRIFAMGGDPMIVEFLLRRHVGDRVEDGVAWAFLELAVGQERDGKSRVLQAEVCELLRSSDPEALEVVRTQLGRRWERFGPWTTCVARACAMGSFRSLFDMDLKQVGSYSINLDGGMGIWSQEVRDPVHRGLRAWVLSGPLTRPSLAELRQVEWGPEVRLQFVASPPFVRSLWLLAKWFQRAGVADVFRIGVASRPLELPGEGAVEADETFEALRRHVGARLPGFGVLFTERPDSEGWFARHRGSLAVVHVDAFVRRQLETPNLVYAAHMLVKKTLDMGLERWERWGVPGLPGQGLPFHQPSRGCVFDFCGDKSELDQRVRAGSICVPCRRALIEERGVPGALVEAVERVLEAGAAELDRLG